MARNPEMYHTQFNNPNKVRHDIQLDTRPKDERSRTEKVARISKKVNMVTAPIWLGVAGVGVATANPILIGAGAVGAGVDTAQGVGSHVVENRAKKKRIAEANNGQHMSVEAVRDAYVAERDLPQNQELKAGTVQDLEQGPSRSENRLAA
jgi:hypothetical protein